VQRRCTGRERLGHAIVGSQPVTRLHELSASLTASTRSLHTLMRTVSTLSKLTLGALNALAASRCRRPSVKVVLVAALPWASSRPPAMCRQGRR